MIEVAALSSLLPVGFVSGLCLTDTGGQLPIFDWVWLFLAGITPPLGWLFYARILHRREVLTSIWDSLPRENRRWVETVLGLPDRFLPYRWQGGTAEELLLRYALKHYFGSFRGNDPEPTLQQALGRLLFWFAAPCYLSLTSLFFQALVLGYALPRQCEAAAAVGDAFLAFLTAVWFVGSYLYLHLQASRIQWHLDVDPARSGAYVPGGVFQGGRSPPADVLHSNYVRLGILAALGLIATIALPVFSSLV